MKEDVVAKNLLMGYTCYYCKHHNTVYSNDNWDYPWFGCMECLWRRPPNDTKADSTCEDFEMGGLREAFERGANLVYNSLYGHKKHNSK
jgi:hypothetical protein